MEKPVQQALGVQKEAIIAEHGEVQGWIEIRDLTMRFLATFPHAANVYVPYMRKSRARLMLDALRESRPSVKGNFTVVFEADELIYFAFRYRGTEIMRFYPVTCEVHEMQAGEYENTASTFRQRKLIREAIDEFKEVVLS